MEIAIVGGVILALIGFVVWLSFQSKKQGALDERERENNKIREDLEAVKEARDVSRRRATDRLRSEWSRE